MVKNLPADARDVGLIPEWVRAPGKDLSLFKIVNRNSLVVQWLAVCTLRAEGLGSIPSWGTKIPQAAHGRAKKTKK